MIEPAFTDDHVALYHADALELVREFPTGSVGAVVTSPPYLDARPEVASPSLEQLGELFAECRRVVTGPMLVNVGTTALAARRRGRRTVLIELRGRYVDEAARLLSLPFDPAVVPDRPVQLELGANR